MPQSIGQGKAIELAISKLHYIDLSKRSALLDLSLPENGVLKIRAFGKNYLLEQNDLRMYEENTGVNAKPGDQILVLHYLLHDLPVNSGGELITFREFPGGQFYWQPFLRRTVEPLIAKIGNDLPKLRNNLARFDWEPINYGDFGARIHTIGKMFLSLVYRLGDGEFAPAADILFDPCINQILNTEDAAALASRVCLGLI